MNPTCYVVTSRNLEGAVNRSLIFVDNCLDALHLFINQSNDEVMSVQLCLDFNSIIIADEVKATI